MFWPGASSSQDSQHILHRLSGLSLDAVQQMGPLALPIRIGICSGPVILRKTGRDDEDYDVAGITAHIAARLEQQAEPGTVLLSQQSATLVAGVASIESIGKIALKGIEEPSPVFRLVSAADRPSWAVRAGRETGSTGQAGRQKYANTK